jgi:flagellar biogenesis protein FliO
LQAALPQPSGGAARRADKPTSEGAEIAGGTLDLALGFGLVGILLAIPGGIIWLLRRLRRFTDSLVDD